MSIDLKYFPGDKNYLLKTVQAFSKEMLLRRWAQKSFEAYMVLENPMGLEDSFTQNLRESIENGRSILDEAYDLLAAIYRYKHGDNQLTFMWDGRTHMEFYDETWKGNFAQSISIVSYRPEIYRSVIKAALAEERMNVDFLRASVRRTVLRAFKVRISRGRKLCDFQASA